ncbi:MAG TPA: glycosyltransferase family 39 protein [Isosphaeraceae bacterium]
METDRRGVRAEAGTVVAVLGLALLSLGAALGRSGRLTYHEAIVAQGAREMLASGRWLVPTLGGGPWLEKPPLAHWLVALVGWAAGGVDEAVARAPAAAAGAALGVAVAVLASRRLGPRLALLAGAVQVTSAWTVMRGRLAEADIVLACLVGWALVAFDGLRAGPGGGAGRPGWWRWRWAFFALWGGTALAKGVLFGGVLVGATAAAVLAWDRDREALRALAWAPGWLLAGGVALAWPTAVLARHPEALGLWTQHIVGRLAARPGPFAGEPWWSYALAPLAQVLPWTPLALAGAVPSLARAARHRGGVDRLLWAWAVVPAALVSAATVRNGHYLIHALPPWSIWAALGLARLGRRLRDRGWAADRVRRRGAAAVVGLAVAYALGFGLLGPPLDRRGGEWAFYEAAGRAVGPGEPLVLLYDDWDRDPYVTPFGPVPHDLAVRLFYLNRPSCAWSTARGLAGRPLVPGWATLAVIGRDRDVPALRRLGRVETIARGPGRRWDRTFCLFRVTPEADRPAARPGERAPVRRDDGGAHREAGPAR